jgi:flagellar FliL protein
VAIGLGVLVFIVTVSVITFNIMNNRGASQTVVSDPLSPYVGRRPEYSMYTMLGTINTRTRDFPTSYTVTVDMIIGYDLGDQVMSSELISRQFELRDFVRRYFTGKTAAELAPEREDELKAEIRETLNTRFLDKARARIILFNRLDVMEAF